jgi:hypothetical protein
VEEHGEDVVAEVVAFASTRDLGVDDRVGVAARSAGSARACGCRKQVRASFDRVLLLVSGRVAGCERVEADVAMVGWPLWWWFRLLGSTR